MTDSITTTNTTTTTSTSTNYIANCDNKYPDSIVDIITSNNPSIRNLSLTEYILYYKLKLTKQDENHEYKYVNWLWTQCTILDSFRRRNTTDTSTDTCSTRSTSSNSNDDKMNKQQPTNDEKIVLSSLSSCINLYEKVRACFFLYAIHRYHLSCIDDKTTIHDDTTTSTTLTKTTGTSTTSSKKKRKIPYNGYQLLQSRHYDKAIDIFLDAILVVDTPDNKTIGSTNTSSAICTCTAISSALSQAYYELSFQLLGNQVRVSVQQFPGNSWMYETYITSTTSTSRPVIGTTSSIENNILSSTNQKQQQQQQEQQQWLLKNYPSNFHVRNEMLQYNDDYDDTRTSSNGTTTSTGSNTTTKRRRNILKESTPVRMDITHCGWSDIFFLGMDYPEGARVINCSIDLIVDTNFETAGTSSSTGSSTSTSTSSTLKKTPIPPIDTYIEIIDQSVLKLTSIDLKSTTTIYNIQDVFNFGNDYLGLLKAGIIASGIVPIGLESVTKPGSGTCNDKSNHNNNINQPISILFDHIIGPGLGIHLTTHVRDIPKGSRLAVSTNLLASIISIGMRITNQCTNIIGTIQTENERRTIAARAILGEWLGGSGGGWQDSGGIWPGIKSIQGVIANCPISHPEYGISRGQLLPIHEQLLCTNSTSNEPSTTTVTGTSTGTNTTTGCSTIEGSITLQSLQDHLILVHGGMSCNVGPILNMVTDKYLLRESDEWLARQECLQIYSKMLSALETNNIKELASLTHTNFFQPLCTIIPWASNLYTETIIERIQSSNVLSKDFLGFWMLGGASGGGMGFLFTKECKQLSTTIPTLHKILLQTKYELQSSIPFAIDPVIYNFSINYDGSVSMWVNPDDFDDNVIHRTSTSSQDPTTFNNCEKTDQQDHSVITISASSSRSRLDTFLKQLNFDMSENENIRQLYKAGKIGLSQNRLPIDTTLIEDVEPTDVILCKQQQSSFDNDNHYQRGMDELRNGTVGVVTLAAGIGSRWTNGAGCVKALNPFCRFDGTFRNFLQVHLAKSCKTSKSVDNMYIPHVVATSTMTHDAIAESMERTNNYNYPGPVYLSKGQMIGVRMIPTITDLQFCFNQQNKHMLDVQAQKVRECGQQAMIDWAVQNGEASDYYDNIPSQCIHPVGHFYEIPNLMLNGTLRAMLIDRPQLKYLMLHNVDTVGANVDPSILGLFATQSDNDANTCIDTDVTMAFEVIDRQVYDVGGGLARVNGKVRMIEGLALPCDEDEFKLSYYNSMTTWIHIDNLLKKFSLHRSDFTTSTPCTSLDEKISSAIYSMARKLPTYVTLKEVKKRWGNAQEDVLLISQFEKLWSDLSYVLSIDETHNDNKNNVSDTKATVSYYVVPRVRGGQLKDVAQLDGWVRDGSATYVESLCSW